MISFPDLLRDAQPGTEKNELSSAQGFRNGCLIPHIFDKINAALFIRELCNFRIIGFNLGTDHRAISVRILRLHRRTNMHPTQ